MSGLIKLAKELHRKGHVEEAREIYALSIQNFNRDEYEKEIEDRKNQYKAWNGDKLLGEKRTTEKMIKRQVTNMRKYAKDAYKTGTVDVESLLQVINLASVIVNMEARAQAATELLKSQHGFSE